MAVTDYGSGTMFVPIDSGTPCPICGKKDGRCSEFYLNNELLYISCKYVTSDEPSGLAGWYKHRVSDGIKKKEINFIPEQRKRVEITEEILELRNSVFTDLRAIINRHIPLGLYKDDKADLTRRGLSDEMIKKLGCFSIPKASHKVWSDCGGYQMQLVNYTVKSLYNTYGNDLLKVPGFIKLKGKDGDYITLKTKMKKPNQKRLSDIRGYFIPYNDYKGRLVGMQYRLSEALLDEKGKPIRYFWLSSYNARSGSPIDFINFDSAKRKDILLVGEGALKVKIASHKLGYLGMAMAGVTNYNKLMEEILKLELRTGLKYKVLLAFDMDKYENIQYLNKGATNEKRFYPVLDAEKKTIDILKVTNHKVAIVEWDPELGKGIDDVLMAKGKLNYKLV